MSNDMTNNMTNEESMVDALIAEFANVGIDPDSINALVNNLAQQLRQTSIIDSDMSLLDAHEIMARVDATQWVFDDVPKTEEQMLGEEAFAVVVASMPDYEPPLSTDCSGDGLEEEEWPATMAKGEVDGLEWKDGQLLEYDA